jgi:hypothetical protein
MLDGRLRQGIVHQEMPRRRFKLITRAMDFNPYSGAVRREWRWVVPADCGYAATRS